MYSKVFNLRGVTATAFVPHEGEGDVVTVVSENKAAYCSLSDWDFSNIDEIRVCLSIMYRSEERYNNAQFVNRRSKNIYNRRIRRGTNRI
jgi:hypothetical protein